MSLVDISNESPRMPGMISLGDDAGSEFSLKVYPNGHFSAGELDWEKLLVPDMAPDSLFINGILARRIFDFLQLDKGGPTTFAEYISDPDCHGAAMYARGIVDFIQRISPESDFGEIYRKAPAIFTYEPQPTPVVVHLLNSRLSRSGIPNFAESNTPHSVLLLGRLRGKPVCFEKRGNFRSRFSTLEAAESFYKTNHRLYVVPE